MSLLTDEWHRGEKGAKVEASERDWQAGRDDETRSKVAETVRVFEEEQTRILQQRRRTAAAEDAASKR